MRAPLSATISLGVGLGIALLVDLDLSSPWTFVIATGSMNLGLLVGIRLGGSRSVVPDRRQRVTTLIERTLPHMRLGLNEQTADQTARLLHQSLRFDAVSITDREKILAFVGAGADHHRTQDPIHSPAIKAAIDFADVVVGDRQELQCDGAGTDGCPLGGVVAAPLVCNGYTVGSLEVYRRRPEAPEAGLTDLTRGLALLLSLQLELAQAHREAQMADIAKLDALRAQINPHFLFNTLNTITMKARTDPEETRRLLVRLSDFLRYAMKHTGHMAPFGEEYFFVRTYLFLEKARFGERLRVRYDVDAQILSIPIPVLTIQPLVENAVKHGIGSKPDGGLVELLARLDPISGTLRICVRDNGVGMKKEDIPALLSHARQRGSALENIQERLIRLYGGRASLTIDSTPGRGTMVCMTLPVGW